ncbi:MAG: hypothetical protein GY801_21090 [bacterium]|nr:hypothetical protein [bacterium]
MLVPTLCAGTPFATLCAESDGLNDLSSAPDHQVRQTEEATETAIVNKYRLRHGFLLATLHRKGVLEKWSNIKKHSTLAAMGRMGDMKR